MPLDEDNINYRTVAQVVLGLLALIITGMCTVALNILIDYGNRLNADDKWLTQLQDAQNSYMYRVQKTEIGVANLDVQKAESIDMKAQASQIMDLKTQLAVIQHQLDTDQAALHDLSDAFMREFPLQRRR